MERWLVMDTETTGLLLPGSAPLEKQPKIIELALVELTVQGGKVASAASMDLEGEIRMREMSWLINPGESLEAVITKITGLKDEDLKDKPRFPELLGEILEWFFGAHGVVCHNAPFDMGMLINELRRCGKEFAFPYPPRQLCTVQHYHQTFGRRAKLTEVYQRIMQKPLPQKHRALDDTRALVEVILKDKVIG